MWTQGWPAQVRASGGDALYGAQIRVESCIGFEENAFSDEVLDGCSAS